MILFGIWGLFFIWAIFAQGWILKRLQHVYQLENKSSCKPYVLGLEMLVYLAIYWLAYFVPSYLIGAIVLVITGFALGFYGVPSASHVVAGQVATLFINSFISTFFIGFIAERVISLRIQKENGLYIPFTLK